MGETSKISLPAGWRVDEDGALRRETIHSMKRRFLDWDYHARSIYMITIELADRRSRALGALVVADRAGNWVEPSAVRAEDLRPEEVRAKIELSALGQIVVECWNEISRQWPGVSTIGCQVMPDHFHGLVFVEERQKKTLGNIIGSFKSKSASRVKAWIAGTEPHAAQDGTALAAERSGAAENRSGASGSSPRAAKFWAEGFVDTIIWREGQLKAERDYLADNPFRLAVKTLYPGLFRNVADLVVALPGFSATAFGHFAALGNRFLLKRPLAQVQVSRRAFAYKRVAKSGGGVKIARDSNGEPVVELETADYRARKAEFLALAKHGAVLLSPCVSDGERQIAHEALAAKLPLVTMANKGFSKLQKPSGRFFDACAEGRLLMLSPIGWPYQPGEKPMTRFDATAMNRLCQWIAGEGAAEINYHGMRPADIDGLAREAAKVGAIS